MVLGSVYTETENVRVYRVYGCQRYFLLANANFCWAAMETAVEQHSHSVQNKHVFGKNCWYSFANYKLEGGRVR